jgi:hypothetical protein
MRLSVQGVRDTVLSDRVGKLECLVWGLPISIVVRGLNLGTWNAGAMELGDVEAQKGTA